MFMNSHLSCSFAISADLETFNGWMIFQNRETVSFLPLLIAIPGFPHQKGASQSKVLKKYLLGLKELF